MNRPDPASSNDPSSLPTDRESQTNATPDYLLSRLITDLEAMSVDLARAHLAEYASLARRAATELKARI
jgi:hypothetical protein